MANPTSRRRSRGRDRRWRNAHRHKPRRLGFLSPAPLTNHALADQYPLDPTPLVELQFLLAAVPRKTDAQLLRFVQIGQTRSLPVAQGFKVPLRHRPLHVSGNSAAVEASPRQITA